MNPMRPFTTAQHRDALIRRRIKFVVEKGSMARLFKAGTNDSLQNYLFQNVKPAQLSQLETREAYDDWLLHTIEMDCWQRCSRNGIDLDRWGYFAKLINIVVYEIAANRELLSEEGWQRIQPFLHIPIDGTVTYHLTQIDPSFPAVWLLKGMTKAQYLEVQTAVRKLADRYSLPPLWFEAVWSA
jgi:hypothetical protein